MSGGEVERLVLKFRLKYRLPACFCKPGVKPGKEVAVMSSIARLGVVPTGMSCGRCPMPIAWEAKGRYINHHTRTEIEAISTQIYQNTEDVQNWLRVLFPRLFLVLPTTPPPGSPRSALSRMWKVWTGLLSLLGIGMVVLDLRLDVTLCWSWRCIGKVSLDL